MEVIIGIISAFFFAFTFVLNELMANEGGNFLWSASLRFIFVLPIMYVFLRIKGYSALKILKKIEPEFKSWFIYSQIGFVAFYLPLCYASSFAPGWLVASIWQLSIVCGTLLIPFIREHEGHFIDPKDFIYFAIILLGIFVIESVNVKVTGLKTVIVGTVSILIACFSYPLGNRKIMNINEKTVKLSPLERTFAMTILTFPSWVLVAVIAAISYGSPSKVQFISGFLVALFSGFIATVLFFKATQMVSQDMRKLASVEATTSFEIIFSVILGMILLKNPLPSTRELLGMALVIFGMLLKTYSGSKNSSITKPRE